MVIFKNEGIFVKMRPKNDFFFFFISKHTNKKYIYEERKWHLKADPKHTKGIQEGTKRQEQKEEEPQIIH